MKEITYFMQRACPHCLLADRLLAELCAREPRYATIPIRRVDELAEPELAGRYDYWYVPTFYVGGVKLHEGHAEAEDVKRVLDAALAD